MEDLPSQSADRGSSSAQTATTASKIRDMNVTIVDGDLLDQDVDVIVNAWNRNISWNIAVQINHPCRWHQHAVAISGALNS